MRIAVHRGRLRSTAAVVAAIIVTVLSACSPAATGPSNQTSAAGSPADPRSAAAVPGSPADPDASALAAARRRAGIAGCPDGDSKAAARPDGLPDLRLSCLGGRGTVRLAGLRDAATVINIWAQWCGPCREEAPHLAAVSKAAGDRVRFIGIDYDDPDPLAAIEFARSVGWRYPQLQDPSRAIQSRLRLIGIPATIFVDAAGRITYRHNGPFSSDDQLRTAIHDHLGVTV